MNLVIIGGRKGPRSIDLSQPRYYFLMGFSVAFIAALLLYAGYYFGQSGTVTSNPDPKVNNWVTTLKKDRQDIQKISQQTADDLNALALNLGQMEARSLRLDALGSRLAKIAGIGEDEFDFNEDPPAGGPADTTALSSSQLPELLQRFTELQRQIDDRQYKFELMESILMDRELIEQALPEGKPVKKGWLSSKYGRRTDPFTGKRSWHAGVDFAGKHGAEVISVASGVVTHAGYKKGFGRMVEVSHGNGYVTRYAHNSKNLVKVGDTVEKGGLIAKMGSSGRSTGPHVHFEVLRDGKVVNPSEYIRRVAKH